MMETQVETIKETKETNVARRILRTLELIHWMNEELALAKESNDPIGLHQYQHFKNKLVRELMELLAQYQIPVQLQEAPESRVPAPMLPVG